MVALLCFVFAILASSLKSRSRLEAENTALRHQLIILCRQRHVRVRLTNNDRWFFIQLYRWFPSILKVSAMRRQIHRQATRASKLVLRPRNSWDCRRNRCGDGTR